MDTGEKMKSLQVEKECGGEEQMTIIQKGKHLWSTSWLDDFLRTSHIQNLFHPCNNPMSSSNIISNLLMYPCEVKLSNTHNEQVVKTALNLGEVFWLPWCCVQRETFIHLSMSIDAHVLIK